nr:MAG TPA: hypothetical protein [Caudoviricetes sp.]
MKGGKESLCKILLFFLYHAPVPNNCHVVISKKFVGV